MLYYNVIDEKTTTSGIIKETLEAARIITLSMFSSILARNNSKIGKVVNNLYCVIKDELLEFSLKYQDVLKLNVLGNLDLVLKDTENGLKCVNNIKNSEDIKDVSINRKVFDNVIKLFRIELSHLIYHLVMFPTIISNYVGLVTENVYNPAFILVLYNVKSYLLSVFSSYSDKDTYKSKIEAEVLAKPYLPKTIKIHCSKPIETFYDIIGYYADFSDKSMNISCLCESLSSKDVENKVKSIAKGSNYLRNESLLAHGILPLHVRTIDVRKVREIVKVVVELLLNLEKITTAKLLVILHTLISVISKIQEILEEKYKDLYNELVKEGENLDDKCKRLKGLLSNFLSEENRQEIDGLKELLSKAAKVMREYFNTVLNDDSIMNIVESLDKPKEKLTEIIRRS